ncbi:hypothetical protein F511_44453 [Dorcoceras hygrometricum]|uniref:Dystroglycan-like n=1 Tax=Dorcoceras hygrometricum TaxID=472368 RepID=A0A2Z7BD73_9LAMI|nr:hypothetical protein F511_44453 [Dorcoceras hygrometricum]
MASSFYNNSQHVDFDSVLAMDDQGMVSMFQALMASGLAVFLGCPAVIYETALIDFCENASVRDGVIISTMGGQLVEISEEWFAESFELPADGLGDLSEIPKDVIFDAKSIVSLSGEPVSLSGRKSQMKFEFRLLCDIMAKAISVKAGSFNSITVEKFSLVTTIVCGVRMNWAKILFNTLNKMVSPGTKQAKGFAIQISLLLENIPNLELGESLAFPASKILSDKNVHRIVSLYDRESAEEVTEAPKPKAASKKRPAADVEVAVAKKKRTIKTKSITSLSTLKIVAVAQEIVPLQMVEPCPDVPAIEEHVKLPTAEEGISAAQSVEVSIGKVATEIDASADRVKPADTNEERHWFDLSHEELITKWAAEWIITSPADTDEEIGDDKPFFKSVEAVESVVEVEEAAADKDFLVVDDPDTVINQVLQHLDSSSADKDVKPDEEAETMDVDTAGGGQQVRFSEEEPVVQKTNDDLLDDYEQTSLEDILLTIPVDVPLPSAGMEITKIVMGKAILVEKDPIKGNPAQEHYFLICADIDLLVALRAKKEELVLSWGETESPQLAIQRKFYILLKYREVLVWKFLESWRSNFVPGQGSSAVELSVIDLLSDLHLSVLEELTKEARTHGITWKKTCCSKMFEGSPRDRGAVIARSNTNTRSSCWIRTMLRVDGAWIIEPCADQVMKKRWADICFEVVDFCASRRLLPVGSLQFCSSLSVVEPVSRVAPRQSSVFAFKVSQFCSVFVDFNSAVSGSADRTPTFAQRVEIAQRRIVETVLDADRNAESLERQAAAERDRERSRRKARLLKRRRS